MVDINLIKDFCWDWWFWLDDTDKFIAVKLDEFRCFEFPVGVFVILFKEFFDSKLTLCSAVGNIDLCKLRNGD